MNVGPLQFKLMEMKGLNSIRFKAPGNTLPEYAILLGLIAILCIGAIGSLGGSISNLFTLPTEWSSHEQGAETGGSNILVSGASGGSGGQGANASSGSNTGNAVVDFVSNLLPETGSASGLDGSSGVSTNVTSVDGKTAQVQGVQQTLSSAKAMQDTIASLPDGPLKEWYKQVISEVYLIAGTEATFSYAKYNIISLAPLAQTNMPQGDALFETANHFHNLNTFMATLPSGITDSQRATAIAAVTGVIDNLKSGYSDALSKYTTVSTDNNGITTMQVNIASLIEDNIAFGQANYTKQASEVAQLAPTMLSNGSTDQTPAVKDTLTSGLTASSATK